MTKLISIRTSEGGKTAFDYYTNGLLKTVTDPNGHIMSYYYDVNWNLTEILDNAFGKHVDYTYDSAGKMTTKKDQLSNVTSYAYDENDNMIKITDAMNGTATFSFDMNNRLVGVTDPMNKTTSYT